MTSRRLAWGIAVGVAAIVGAGSLYDHPSVERIAWSTAAPQPFEPMDVAYTGCRMVWLEVQPRCLVKPDASLRLWLTQPATTQVSVRIDGETQPVETYLVDGMDGFGLEVVIPPQAGELVVELPKPGLRWSRPLDTWSKGMKPPPSVATSHEVDAALGNALLASMAGRHSEALKRLAEVEDLAARYPKGQADLATYRGIVHWSQGRHHDAATSLRQGVEFATKLRDAGLESDALPVYAGVLAELGYADAAVDWSEQVLTLARTEPPRASCVDIAKWLSSVGYAHLLVARQRGEAPARARALLEQAFARVGPKGECPDPGSVPAILLSLTDAALDRGDPTAAIAVLAGVDFASVPTSDERLRLRDAEVRALDAVGRPWTELTEPLARLEEAAMDAGTAEGRWRLASRRGDVLVRRGRLEEAVEAYREAEREAQQLAQLAAVGVGRDAAITAHGESTERLVELLVELGRPEDALCAAREAQARRIQAVGRQPPTPEQREALDHAIDTYDAARKALDEAMSQGRLLPRQEQERLRLEISRSETRRSEIANEILQAQSTWRPSCTELVPRAAGELLLGIYPAKRGWFVFVQDDMDTSARWLERGPKHTLDDPALGSELLDPWTERLRVARRVRVLASGRAQAVDVHFLTWNGRRLIEQVPVAYGAELPRPEPANSANTEPVALLVADPTESLSLAPQEVREAADWMTAQGWTLDIPTPDEASREQILDALPEASFFYFAGHGKHDVGKARSRALPPYAGGTRDWPARLELRPPSVLEVQDVLMLDSTPRYVALLGCETGVTGGGGGGMSLALAFLVAGADEVVATPAEAADTVAFATGLGLLSGMSAKGVSLVTGLQRAQADMLRDGKPVGQYRVWVR